MTDYYVDGAVGDDANAGTAEGAGNAWATLNKAEDTMSASGGDRCFVKASASYAETLTLDKSFSTSQFANRFIGYTSTPGDGGKATIDATGLTYGIVDNFATRNFRVFENFRITGATQYGLYCDTADYGLMINCEFDNCTTAGVRVDNNWTFINCVFRDNGGPGAQAGVDPAFLRCSFYNNGGSGYVGSHGTFVGCIAYDNDSLLPVFNFSVANGNNLVVNNTLEAVGGSSCLLYFRGYVTAFYDNIFAGGTYGIDPGTGIGGETFYADYNLFYNQSIDAFEGSITIEGPNNVEATDPEFTNAAGGDFTIPASSPAVGVGSTPGNTS